MAETKNNQLDIDDLKAPLLAAVGAADLALERVNEIVATLRERAGEARTDAESRVEESRARVAKLQEDLPAQFDDIRGKLTAEELRKVAEGYAAAAVLAMPDQHLAAQLANLFRTKRFRTYTTDDVVGVEMAGALKNVYAIAVGMGYSLGIGENTRAMVMARAVNEMSKLGVAMGGNRDTFAGLAGMGDLIVTCTSQRSRNRHVGEQLGAGKPIEEIIESMNQVAEGVKAASVIMEFADKLDISMPIAREVDGVVNHGSTVEQAYQGLMVEKPGHEVFGSGF